MRTIQIIFSVSILIEMKIEFSMIAFVCLPIYYWCVPRIVDVDIARHRDDDSHCQTA